MLRITLELRFAKSVSEDRGLFRIEKVAIDGALWRLAGLWPGSAKRRLWLPETFQIASAPKFKLVISVMVRNEEPYLDEWLEFHRMMGVEHFYIYDNGSSDGTVAKLRQSSHADRITLIDWANFLFGWEGVAGPLGRMQRLAMLHSIANYGHLTEWMAFVDADEFLFPAKTGTLLDILDEYDDLESLSVYWNMFGTSNHLAKPDGLVTENFTRRSRRRAGPHKNLCRVKTIVRPRAVRGVHNTHTLILQNGYPESWTEKRVHIGFADHRPQHFSDEIVRINHYYSKSKLEYYKRRGAPKEGARRDFRSNDGLLNYIDQDTVEDLTIQRFVPELKRRLKDPG
jgi:hypothetical protein